MLKNLFILPFLLLPFVYLGCGPSTGAEGDANDPATSTDEEQMQDETDEDLNTE